MFSAQMFKRVGRKLDDDQPSAGRQHTRGLDECTARIIKEVKHLLRAACSP